VFLYAADHTPITASESEDGTILTLAEGRLQKVAHAVSASWSDYQEPFSLVMVRKDAEEICFVRDPFGLSTFYYVTMGDCVLFSPNAKELLAVFPELRKVNPQAIAEYHLFNHIAGANTIFAEVKQLEAGDAAVVSATGIDIRAWWRPRFATSEAPIEEATARLGKTLREIVQEQWEMASGRAGLLLSGGIDSSLVCSYLTEHRTGLPTFSVDIPNYERTDRPYFMQVSRTYRTRHTTITVDNDDFARHLGTAVWHMEEPLSLTNSVPLMLACQTAKRSGCDWMITGEGCDGLFSGGMKAVGILRQGMGHDSRQETYEEIVLSYAVTSAGAVRTVLADTHPIDLGERLRILEEAAHRHGPDNYENLLNASHLRTYSEKLTRRVARMSVAGSVTCLSPFLTRTFVDCLFTIPFASRNHQGIAKYPMVQLAASVFGQAFVSRPKVGFNVPNSRWFKSAAGLGRFRPLLLEERTLARGFYRPDSVRNAVLFRLEHDEAPLDYLLWSTLNLELWMRMFIDGDDVEQIGALRWSGDRQEAR
jgi:asparagine synthase (glutamine-hydrolysing)